MEEKTCGGLGGDKMAVELASSQAQGVMMRNTITVNIEDIKAIELHCKCGAFMYEVKILVSIVQLQSCWPG